MSCFPLPLNTLGGQPYAHPRVQVAAAVGERVVAVAPVRPAFGYEVGEQFAQPRERYAVVLHQGLAARLGAEQFRRFRLYAPVLPRPVPGTLTYVRAAAVVVGFFFSFLLFFFLFGSFSFVFSSFRFFFAAGGRRSVPRRQGRKSRGRARGLGCKRPAQPHARLRPVRQQYHPFPVRVRPCGDAKEAVALAYPRDRLSRFADGVGHQPRVVGCPSPLLRYDFA